MRPLVVLLAILGLGAPARAQSCHLSYGNGALIPNVKVVALYWGTTNNGQYKYKDQLHQYYDAVTNSAYFDWLSEYDSGSYMIGRGGFAAEYADAAAPAKATIDETNDLQPWINKLIDGGKIPAPDANTLYFVHLPGSSQVSSGAGGTTCSDNCAYHYFYMKGSAEVRYAVIPDQNSGACSTNQACPIQLPALDRLTIVASHELVEAVTDPNGMGWIDDNQQCGEIGDICVGQPGKAAGYTVQLEWSNKNGKCIDHDPNVVFNDFSLALQPASVSVAAGASATAMVQAMPTAGSQVQAVALTVDGLPTGLTGTFASASVQSNAATALTLAAAPGMAAGSYAFTVTGKAADGAKHSVGGMVVVTEAAPTVGGGDGGGNGEGAGAGNGTGGNGNGNGNGNGGVDKGGGCAVGGSGDGGFVVLLMLGAISGRRWWRVKSRRCGRWI